MSVFKGKDAKKVRALEHGLFELYRHTYMYTLCVSFLVCHKDLHARFSLLLWNSIRASSMANSPKDLMVY
jgi:hypothetical protein